MSKTELIESILQTLKDQLATMKRAISDSEESASGQESKSEGKYDTRAIEASYLAEAQKAQLHRLAEEIAKLEKFQPLPYLSDEPIGPGAMVEVQIEDEISFLLLAPAGGGQTAQHLGCPLTIISPESQLYQKLIGKKMVDFTDASSQIQILNVE